MSFLQSPYHTGSHGRMTDWIYRGNISGYVFGGANHYGGGGTGVWYWYQDIYSISFSSDGNAVDTTGDLTQGTNTCGGFSSETTSFIAGGSPAGGGSTNVIESFPNANPSAGGTDLANLTSASNGVTPVSSLTHGYVHGIVGSANFDKFAFASTSNATGVNNLSFNHGGTPGGGATDSRNDYGYVAGGGSPTNVNAIERFSFVNENVQDDVGDVTIMSSGNSGCSSETHGYFIGGGNLFSNIDRYLFASSGNATDVGNIPHDASLWGGGGTGTSRSNGMSSMTHGYVAGGELYTDMDKFSFANESNTTDIGDLGSGLTTLRAHTGSSHY